jgi:hypothetical protein
LVRLPAQLVEALSRCDQEHMPAYLESSNAANMALYQRFGFEALGDLAFADLPRHVRFHIVPSTAHRCHRHVCRLRHNYHVERKCTMSARTDDYDEIVRVEPQ